MNEQVKEYIKKYPSEIIDMYNNLRKMIFDSVSCEIEEILWAKLPSYKITPKGMVQIYLKQDIPYEVLKQIFAETLYGI